MLTSALSAHAQVSLKGQLKDLNTDTIIVSTTDAKLEKGTRDTLVIKNGKISLSYPTTNLLHVKIIEKPKIGRRTGDGFDFYLLPGKPMTINGSKFDYTIKGCDIYKKIEAYQKVLLHLKSSFMMLLNLITRKLLPPRHQRKDWHATPNMVHLSRRLWLKSESTTSTSSRRIQTTRLLASPSAT